MSIRTWTEAEIRALGVRTDLVTMCSIVYGCGRTKAYELLARGELHFPVLKSGHRYVVATSHALRLLGLAPDMRDDEASTSSSAKPLNPGETYEKGTFPRAV